MQQNKTVVVHRNKIINFVGWLEVYIHTVLFWNIVNISTLMFSSVISGQFMSCNVFADVHS